MKVGQVNIQNQPLSNLRDLILGEPGTFVVLGFQRGAQVYMTTFKRAAAMFARFACQKRWLVDALGVC